VAQQAGFVDTVLLCERAATTATGRACQQAFNGEDELARLGQLGLEDTDIGNIKRN
jgi:hypothetical protein